MFKLNDWVVYPGLGLFKIIESIEISDGRKFFRLRSNLNATIMIPCSSENGEIVRNLSSKKEISVAYEIMKAPLKGDLPKRLPKLERIAFNKYNSGSIFEVAEMVKILLFYKKHRKLSVNEIKLLDLGIRQLSEEISLVKNKSIVEIEKSIISAVS